MLTRWWLGLIFSPMAAFAGDGTITIERADIKEPLIIQGTRGFRFQKEYDEALGLKEHDVRGLHIQRIGCARRLYAPDGKSLEGDGDIKVVSLGGDLMEAEMPVHLSFDLFAPYNPFHNGVRMIDTISSRQVVSVKDWKDGQPLRLKKQVMIHYDDSTRMPDVVTAHDEIKRYQNYPGQFIIRERIFLKSGTMEFYMLCE